MKDNLLRLVPTIERERQESEHRKARHQAEASLKASEAERKRAEQLIHLQAMALQSAANAIAITDRQGVITWVNTAFTRLTGYTPADVIGQNPRILKSGMHPPASLSSIVVGRGGGCGPTRPAPAGALTVGAAGRNAATSRAMAAGRRPGSVAFSAVSIFRRAGSSTGRRISGIAGQAVSFAPKDCASRLANWLKPSAR